MTQIANNMLVVATVFIGSWTISTYDSQRRGAYTRDKISVQELDPKCRGRLMHEGGGVFAGFLGIKLH